MWSFHLERFKSGSGQKKNIRLEIPEAAINKGEYFKIIIEEWGVVKNSQFKVKDSNGSQHDLPYFFKKDELSLFTIIDTTTNTSTDWCECNLHVWPKELPNPIAKYFSISTVNIILSSRDYISTHPMLKYRKKGEEQWVTTKDTQISFARCDDTCEAQLFYQLPNNNIVQSPILNVECMWLHFDIEKECQIDLTKLIENQLFDVTINLDSLYKTITTATMRMIEPIDYDEQNKEVEIMSFTDKASKKNNSIKLVSGARYEFKLSVSKPQVSYSRIIEVPYFSVDENLWKTIVGDHKSAIFQAVESEWEEGPINWESQEHEMYQKNVKAQTLTIYKHGFCSYKSTFQRSERFVSAKELIFFAGAFKLVQAYDMTVHIEVTKLFQKILPFKPLAPLLSAVDPDNQELLPTALLLPELLQTISKFVDYNQKLTNRLVCKYWCSAFKPTMTGQLTSKSLQMNDKVFMRKQTLFQNK